MNNGDDSAFYLACGYRVVAVEADPTLVAAARKRFSVELASGRLRILNVGMAEQSGEAEFWINEVRSEWNSFSRELTARRGEPCHMITIPCRRLDEVMAEEGIPHYLKIDIEGTDLACCRQLSPATKPTYISVEISEAEQISALQTLGYNRFKLVTQLDLRVVKAEPINPCLHVLRLVHRAANHRMEDRSLVRRLLRAVPAQVLRVTGAMGLQLWGEKTPFRSKLLPEWNFRIGSPAPLARTCPASG